MPVLTLEDQGLIQGVPFDPFLSYAFLSALEESNSAVANTGWAPYHLVLEHETRGIVGVVPMYLKSHSQGEYVFDYSRAASSRLPSKNNC
jgi:predicted N-acyltransferase